MSHGVLLCIFYSIVHFATSLFTPHVYKKMYSDIYTENYQKLISRANYSHIGTCEEDLNISTDAIIPLCSLQIIIL